MCNAYFFFHPDFTVGFGIMACHAPNQLCDNIIQVADFTASRELHPAPKNFLYIYATTILCINKNVKAYYIDIELLKKYNLHMNNRRLRNFGLTLIKQKRMDY